MTDFQLKLSKLQKHLRHGYALLEQGHQPSYSSSICGCITCGFGELDEYGYWEFPLVMSEDEDVYLTIEEYLS